MTGENLDDAVIVALGSNLAGEYISSCAVLNRAFEEFSDIGLIVKAKSSIWRSKSWPDATKPDYVNAVAIVETKLIPRAALEALHALEARFGRTRGAANASRVLDLDLIAYGREVCDGGGLVLPHPRAADRRFVMGPLAEIAPGWRHPTSEETAAALNTRALIGRDAAPIQGSPPKPLSPPPLIPAKAGT
jgi:2-amino-4-hydroxy-6-hydroxymethyldihydropteridine diphosphokinase